MKRVVALIIDARLKALTWQTPFLLQAEDQTSLVHAWPTPNTFDCFDVQQLETDFRVVPSTSHGWQRMIMVTTGYSWKTGLRAKAYSVEV